VRFEVEVPDNQEVVVQYGLDRVLGWFGELLSNDRVVDEYDSLSSNYDHARPLDGLLRWMVQHDVFSQADLQETLTRLIHERSDQLPERLRGVGEIVSNLRLAGDGSE
jgi:hypothetical protein